MNGKPFCKKCKNNAKEKVTILIGCLLFLAFCSLAAFGAISVVYLLSGTEDCVQWEPEYGQCQTITTKDGMTLTMDYNGTQYHEPQILAEDMPNIEITTRTNCEVIGRQCVLWRKNVTRT